MPYKKNNNYKKKTYKKKINYNRGKYKKSYKSRFNDKKINTAIEKKIQDIAIAEDQKALEYYVVRGTFLLGNNVYPTDDTYPTLAQSIVLPPNQHFYREMGKIGGYLSTDLASSGATVPPAFGGADMAINLHIKQIKMYIRVLNTSLQGETATVDIRVVRVPFSKRYLAQTLGSPLSKPILNLTVLPPFCEFNKLTPECKELWNQSAFATGTAGLVQNPRNIDFQTVCSHRFKIPRGKMLDDPALGGGNRINSQVWIEKTITRNYKGMGRKEPYEFESLAGPHPNTIIGNTSKNIYYMSVKSDQDITFQALTSVKFCRGKAQASQLVFDRVAPGAQ